MANPLKKKAVYLLIDQLISRLEKKDSHEDRSKVYAEAARVISSSFEGMDEEKTEKLIAYVSDPSNRWIRVIDDVLDRSDPHYAKQMLKILGYNAMVQGTSEIRASREKYNCNIPWLILFDPTSACNMHCIGCWSGTYGHKNSLSFEDMDKIVREGRKLGTYLYFMTGGEPLVKKNDILRLCEKYSDCFFAAFTNSTLIDEELCQKVQKLGNLTFLLSIEGTEETNDARRGEGHYDAVIRAMDLLNRYGIVFGTSVCYTKDNVYAVTSDEFLNMLADKGAHFGFWFHLMPVGNNAAPELMPTPEQRLYMIHRIREIRSKDCEIEFYPMDFQNDGEYVGGCIAGGRNYFHINASGDAEPCVFIHFSDTNIRDNSILEMLQAPLFRAYHEGQPFNRNHLRPCPMLENPEILREIVNKTGAHQTNEESPESVEHLCAKCDDYAAKWKPAADEEWARETHKKAPYENYTEEKREHPELAAFEHADGTAGITSVK